MEVARTTNDRIQAVLVWARFPYYQLEPAAGETVVTLRDLRFGDRVDGVRAVFAASPGSARPADRAR